MVTDDILYMQRVKFVCWEFGWGVGNNFKVGTKILEGLLSGGKRNKSTFELVEGPPEFENHWLGEREGEKKKKSWTYT